MFAPQPLRPSTADRDRTIRASATVSRGTCRSRLRTDFIPAKGSSRNPRATGAKGLAEEGFSLRAVWLVVWMMRVTEVAALPAGRVAGEKTAVAPVGNPDAVKVSGLG